MTTCLQVLPKEVITDRLKQTLTKAAEDTNDTDQESASTSFEIAPDNRVETTEEELEAYRVVRAILREVVDVKRVVVRDAQSYCAILFDDNNRKPICRLYFSGQKKYVGIMDANKQEERVQIEDLDDIYKYADKLKKGVSAYLELAK